MFTVNKSTQQSKHVNVGKYTLKQQSIAQQFDSTADRDTYEEICRFFAPSHEAGLYPWIPLHRSLPQTSNACSWACYAAILSPHITRFNFAGAMHSDENRRSTFNSRIQYCYSPCI